MFSALTNAVSHILGSRTETASDLAATDNSTPTPESEDTSLNPSSDYPFSYGYNGPVQPQYGCQDSVGSDQSSAARYAQLRAGCQGEDAEAVNNAPQGGTRSINGKITHVYNDYGLIDNTVHFKFDSVRFNVRPKVGADVEAVIESGGHQDVGLRATEVTISSVVDWSDSNSSTEEVEWFIGKVTSTDKTSGVIEDGISYDQDAYPYNYFPHRGDWVMAEILRDHESKKSRVKSIRPLREKTFKGYVTNLYLGYGFIDGSIFFSCKACERNYKPAKDDLVEGRAIESEQSKGKWRAVSVAMKKQHSAIHPKQFPAHDFKAGEMMKNKHGIVVMVGGEFGKMQVDQENEVTAYVRNDAKETKRLAKCEAVCLLGDVKVLVNGVAERNKKANAFTKPTDLAPGTRLPISLVVTARRCGKSICHVILSFDNFSISRPIPISVQEGSDEPHSFGSRTGQNKWLRDHSIKASGLEASVIPGIRPPRRVAHNPNVPVKLPMYPISRQLRQCFAEKRDVTELVPELRQALSLDSYFMFFSTLLHLEELKMEVDMREFDLDRASMRPRGEFLTLEVPGLAEGRPSVLVGDKIMLTEPFGGSNAPKFEGFVHEVHNEDILLKFHPMFHEKYGAEEFDVMFTFSRTGLRRCHHAAEFAVNLGKEVLFPTELQAKEPQVDIIFATIQRSVVYPGPRKPGPPNIVKLPVPEYLRMIKASPTTINAQSTDAKNPSSPKTSSDNKEESGGPKFVVPNALTDSVTMVSEEIEKKEEDKAEFFNKRLNSRQRAAVIRILKGEGRPTPYILFGPPGTGKTVTVVETMIQIHLHLPSSRILACTPSNSAADLLTERLHLSGQVKQIDMVRLNAFRRMEESIPESIHRYCTVGDELRAVAHHRIIISTCATAGMFFSMGLKAGHFSHVIVDEAGQATEPEALVAMAMAAGPDGQVVLAGDPMQLGPVLASSQAAELGFEQSLLERLMKRDLYQRDNKTYINHGGYNPLLVTKLVNNYRSHPMLLKLPSRCFYDDELNACADVEMREMLCSWDMLPNKKSCPIIFHGIQGMDMKEGNSPSWCNPAEALQAVIYLQQLLKCSELHLKESDIGIITPYRKQVEKINLLLDTVDILEAKVGSVEEFQGQERPVIIISTVRSSSSLMAFDIRHQLGFLSNPKRFNVAITRPQALLIVVGNPHLLVSDFYWRALLRYCLKNDAYVGCEPPSKETMNRLTGPGEEGMDAEPFQEDQPSDNDPATQEMSSDGKELSKKLTGSKEDAMNTKPFHTNLPSEKVARAQEVSTTNTEKSADEEGKDTACEAVSPAIEGGAGREVLERQQIGVLFEREPTKMEDTAMEEQQIEDDHDGDNIVEGHHRKEANPQEGAEAIVGHPVENVCVGEVNEDMPELLSSKNSSAAEEEKIRDECETIGEEHQGPVAEIEVRVDTRDVEGNVVLLQSEYIVCETEQMASSGSRTSSLARDEAPRDGMSNGRENGSKGHKKQQRREIPSLADRCIASLKDFRAQVGAARQECEHLVAKQKVKDIAQDIAEDLHTMKLRGTVMAVKAKVEIPAGNGVMSDLESVGEGREDLSSSSEDSWGEEDFFFDGREQSNSRTVVSNVFSGSVTRNKLNNTDSASSEGIQDASGGESPHNSKQIPFNASATPSLTTVDFSNDVKKDNANISLYESCDMDRDRFFSESGFTPPSKRAINIPKQKQEKEREAEDSWEVYENGNSLLSDSFTAWSNVDWSNKDNMDHQSFSRGWYPLDGADNVTLSQTNSATKNIPPVPENQRVGGIYPDHTKHHDENQTTKVRLPSLLNKPKYKPREDRNARQANGTRNGNPRNGSSSTFKQQRSGQTARSTTASPSAMKEKNSRSPNQWPARRKSDGHLSEREHHHRHRDTANRGNQRNRTHSASNTMQHHGARDWARSPNQQRISPVSNGLSNDDRACYSFDSGETTGEFFDDSWKHGSHGRTSPAKHDYTRNQGSRRRDFPPRFTRENSNSSPGLSRVVRNLDMAQPDDRTPRNAQESRNAISQPPRSSKNFASSKGIQQPLDQFSRRDSPSVMDHSYAALSDLTRHSSRGRGLMASPTPSVNPTVGKNSLSTEQRHKNPTQAANAASPPVSHSSPGFGRGLYKPPGDIAQRPHTPGVPRGRGGVQRGPGRGGTRGRGRGRGLLATNFSGGQM